MSEHHYLNIIQKLDADHPQMFKIDILFRFFLSISLLLLHL